MTSRSKKRKYGPLDFPLEDDEQIWLMDWAITHPICSKFLIANPMGGLRPKSVGAKLKKMGAKAGVVDLFLAYPSRCSATDREDLSARSSFFYSGLWIELKRRKVITIHELEVKNKSWKSTTPEQDDWIALMLSVGYQAKTCNGCDEAKDCILEYLGEKK